MDHVSALLQRNGAQVWDIDESYTSKMCHKCKRADCEMHKAKLKLKDEEEVVPCYHVLHCKRCQVFMQRDVNASLNILLLTRYELEGRARPEYLSRIAHRHDNMETTEKPDQVK